MKLNEALFTQTGKPVYNTLESLDYCSSLPRRARRGTSRPFIRPVCPAVPALGARDTGQPPRSFGCPAVPCLARGTRDSDPSLVEPVPLSPAWRAGRGTPITRPDASASAASMTARSPSSVSISASPAAAFMVWGVFTGTVAGPGFLAGDYVGASGEASLGVGVGAPASWLAVRTEQ